MKTGKHVAILATLDTKGAEVAALKEIFASLGLGVIVIDIGSRSPAAILPDISHREVADQAGWQLDSLLAAGSKEKLMAELGKGAGKILLQLYAEGRMDGVMGLGGNQGSAVSSLAMRMLPYGFPKYLVSTVASGNIRPYIGEKDIAVVFSVADFLGSPNPVTTSILANAAAALAGMVAYGKPLSPSGKAKTIAITALGNTEAGASRAVRQLQAEGFQVVPFHASGAGGTAMESLIEAGLIDGVLDLTTHELTEEAAGAGVYQPVRPGRLTAAGARGIPQVISLGGTEYLCFGPRDSIPPSLRKRKIYMHNPFNANVKASRPEMAQVGLNMAARLNQSRGPVAVIVPLKGWSIYGSPGGPLHDEAGNRALLKNLKRHLRPDFSWEEMPAAINDPVFIDRCVRKLLEMMKHKRKDDLENDS
jgi:uncharacterized protein (UPF0261 family)